MLENYIKSMLDKGYTEEQIKNYMQQYGYNPNDIDNSIKNVKYKKLIPKIAIGSGVLIVLILFVYMIMPSDSIQIEQPRQIDYEDFQVNDTFETIEYEEFEYEEIDTDQDGVFDDEDIFPYDHDNDGLDDDIDEDDDEDGIKDEQDEYPLDHDNDILQDKEDLDDDNDGILDNNDEFLYDQDNDGIPDKEDYEIQDIEVCDCEDYDPCTKDECIKGECVYTKIEPCCGNFICEEQESNEECPEDCVIERVNVNELMKQAKESVAKDAIEICEQITIPEKKDKCLKNIAVEKKIVEACDKISNNNKRDECYLNLALENMYYCEKIKDEFYKRSCENYKKLNLV